MLLDISLGVVPALAFGALRLEGAGLRNRPFYDVAVTAAQLRAAEL